MKETLKRIKADIIVSALLCIALGIVLLVWPAETIDVFCKILAVGLIIMGGVDIASYFMNRSIHPFAGALGLIVLLIGIWIFLRPESIVSLIPIDRRDPLRTWNPGSEACGGDKAQRLWKMVEHVNHCSGQPGVRCALYRECVRHGKAGTAVYRNCPDL